LKILDTGERRVNGTSYESGEIGASCLATATRTGELERDSFYLRFFAFFAFFAFFTGAFFISCLDG
jgi:hypothetical protein